MSHAYGKLKFEHGPVFHYEYNGTADIAGSAIRATAEQVSNNWREPDDSECTCGKPPEDIRLMTFYGGGFSWDGKGCPSCMCITDGFMPFDVDPKEINLRDGIPAWAKEGQGFAADTPDSLRKRILQAADLMVERDALQKRLAEGRTGR